MSDREPKTPRSARPIETTVVQSPEPIDLDEWLYRYARAIVEAKAKRASKPTAQETIDESTGP
jgi:hypothetical protein